MVKRYFLCKGTWRYIWKWRDTPRHNCKHHACTLTHTCSMATCRSRGCGSDVWQKLPPHNTSIMYEHHVPGPCQIMIAYFSIKMLLTYIPLVLLMR
jgi:hypothetical protein